MILLNKFLGVQDKIINISFEEDGHFFQCLIPDNQQWNSIKDILLVEDYEMVQNFKLSNFRNGIIIDGGAHVGLFSLKASPYAKQIIGIEPDPMNYKLYKVNIKRNNIRNVIFVNKALWSKPTHVSFLREKLSSSGRVIDKEINGCLSISTVTLWDIVKNYEKIDLLKIDIEGAEFEVLLKAPKAAFGKIEHIVGEIHLSTGKNDIAPLIEKLEKNNYEVNILNLPSCYYTYSLLKLMKRWKKVKHLLRLKLTVFFFYTFLNLALRLGLYFPKLYNLKIIYATKSNRNG